MTHCKDLRDKPNPRRHYLGRLRVSSLFLWNSAAQGRPAAYTQFISSTAFPMSLCARASHADGNSSEHPLQRFAKKDKVGEKMHEEEDGRGTSPCSNPRVTAAKSMDMAEVEATKEQSPKLCGYLNKQSGKGPLRGFKPRWFVYDPRKCYLYYFKSPQDALPLGYIDIGDACFCYDVEGDDGQFEIRTAGKEFQLRVLTFFTLLSSSVCVCSAYVTALFCCQLSLPIIYCSHTHLNYRHIDTHLYSLFFLSFPSLRSCILMLLCGVKPVECRDAVCWSLTSRWLVQGRC